MKTYYKYIGIALVYKNTEDILEFIDSFNYKITEPCRIIIVNSYYDDDTRDKIEKIAKNKNCDFINVENRGYSYGNNKGINYALDRYEFEFVIISNPDIIIKKFDDRSFEERLPIIYAPDIETITGKKQNPNCVRNHRILDFLQYIACKKEFLFLELFVIAVLKIERMLFNCNPLSAKGDRKIYSAHGSFVIISRKAVDALFPVFNDHMFLFHEEIYLAYRAKKMGVTTKYTPFVKIFHKEDGSMRLADVNIARRSHESEIVYYEQRDDNVNIMLDHKN